MTLADPGPLPHPLAESTDISKIVRIDYGGDEDYTALGERALDGWRRWNATWPERPFHETGVAFLSREPLAPGRFEYDSYQLLTRRGHLLERLDSEAIARRFPAYREGVHVDGYFNPAGGWAEASAVVTHLARQARGLGVDVREGSPVDRLVDGGAIVGGSRLAADIVVVCAGAWAPLLLPELASSFRAVGQPVFHLRPEDATPFAADRFPVFGADIARTGWYGFPANADGLVKIANHGVGAPLARDAPPDARVIAPAHEAALLDFLRETFPLLASAPIVGRRLCVYCDTLDEHFWIARDPRRPDVVVATGGSGHAFKFAPVLGDLIADAALGVPHPLATKFRWRPDLAVPQGAEAARHRG